MDSKIAEQILDEMAPTFERIESQSAAILQFLKEKGIATDEQLAPYLERASAASSVRWRALRVRMGRLFSMAEKSDAEADTKKKNEEKAGKETPPETQVADAKKEESDRKPASTGPEEQAKADNKSPGNGREGGEREPAKAPDDNGESAQKQDTAPKSSEVSGQPHDNKVPASRKQDETPDLRSQDKASDSANKSEKKKDAA